VRAEPRLTRLALAALLLLAAPALAAAQGGTPGETVDWRQAREVELGISSFDIAPRTIQLKAGEPVLLRLVNRSGQAHRFLAPELFASARVHSRHRADVAGGSILVAPGETREVALVPAPGRYRAASANLLYRLLGMQGTIVVE
jgi:uncharacterized cupredoxin-like copper-binding protein